MIAYCKAKLMLLLIFLIRKKVNFYRKRFLQEYQGVM